MKPWSPLIVIPCTFFLLFFVDLKPYITHASKFSKYFPSLSRSNSSSSSSSPFLKIIDPQKIISSVTKFSGLILSKKIERDLGIINEICSCDEASLDLYNCVLQVTNFTISLPRNDDHPAVRVKRFRMTWDSYTKPCLYIEVEGVEVMVEFVNLLLTKNNWNELQDMGFPPTLYEQEGEVKSSCATSSSFVRVGNVKMPGAVELKVRSKILNKALTDIQIPLDKIKDLSQMIQDEAKKAEERSGRKGCTTDELYSILQSFFAHHLQELLKSAAVDLAFNGKSGSNTVRDIKRAFSEVRDTMVDYAKDAGDKTINDNLSKLGLNQEQINSVKNIVKSGTFFQENDEPKDDD